jgi:hypothetical protein
MEFLSRFHRVISWQSLPLGRELVCPDIDDKVVSCEWSPSLNSEILAGYHSKDGFPVQQTGVAEKPVPPGRFAICRIDLNLLKPRERPARLSRWGIHRLKDKQHRPLVLGLEHIL